MGGRLYADTDKFVQFRYAPDYLKPKVHQRTWTDASLVCKEIGVIADKSDIILDGGNVIKWGSTVIMCDKVFSENREFYTEKELIKQLHNALEVDKLIFVPREPQDWVGHADGMVRFLDERTVLINSYPPITHTISGKNSADGAFQRSFRMSLHNAGLEYKEISYPIDFADSNSAKGIYINYLQMDNLVLVPTFGLPTDDSVLKQLEGLFPALAVIGIDCNEIAAEGGVLNCISWNIKA
jgi:agmatine deiminase